MHIARIKSGAGAAKPRPIIPIAFANSDACVMNRSVCALLILGSRYRLRSVGSAKSHRDDTSALRARTTFTVAKGQWRTRLVY